MKLVYVSESCDGFFRKKEKENFIYLDKNNHKLKNPQLINRIEVLKIPPNWENVWVCALENGHIQAYGYDAKGRKQYIYHNEWQKQQNLLKFEKMLSFAHCLPEIRKQAYKDAHLKEWTKEKVLGLVILTLDDVHIRIGNKFYEEENQTYGLTTLRRKHLHIEGNKLELAYKAKSGKYRKVNIKNASLVKLIKECSELPGYEIFRYKQGSKYTAVNSQDVNEYLKNISSENHSAKEFRTWGGTVLAVEKTEEAKEKMQLNKRLSFSTTLVKLVAKELGNTQAICREYYIHPKIMDVVNSEDFLKLSYDKEKTDRFGLTAAEKKVIALVKD